MSVSLVVSFSSVFTKCCDLILKFSPLTSALCNCETPFLSLCSHYCRISGKLFLNCLVFRRSLSLARWWKTDEWYFCLASNTVSSSQRFGADIKLLVLHNWPNQCAHSPQGYGVKSLTSTPICWVEKFYLAWISDWFTTALQRECDSTKLR